MILQRILLNLFPSVYYQLPLILNALLYDDLINVVSLVGLSSSGQHDDALFEKNVYVVVSTEKSPF